MVTLVWWVLSLLSICSFSWLAVVIDSIIVIILSVVYVINNPTYDGTVDTTASYSSFAGIGTLIFAICKQFLTLSISGWWILVSPIWLFVAGVFPGGFTITNLLFRNWGIMTLPIWVLVLGIIADVGTLYLLVLLFKKD